MAETRTTLDSVPNGYNGDISPSGLGAVLGHPLPMHLPHAISVSLPTWRDNLDYVNGRPQILCKVKSGYPRFKIHYLIERVGCFLLCRASVICSHHASSWKMFAKVGLEVLTRNAIYSHLSNMQRPVGLTCGLTLRRRLCRTNSA
jgi:hypothetical protein